MINYSRIGLGLFCALFFLLLKLRGIRMLLVSLLFLFSTQIYGQSPEPTFVNYNNKDGLPSSEVYYTLEDRDGFMWFATDRGVVRFNGYEFETFTKEDGLLNNVVFELYEDFKGRIWMLGYHEKLCYYLNGKIYAYEHNHQLLEHVNGKQHLFVSLHVAKDESLYIGTRSDGLLHVNLNGKVTRIDNLKEGSSGLSVKENKLVSFHVPQTYMEVNKINTTTLFYEKDSVFQINEVSLKRPKAFPANNEENICIALGRYLFLYNKQKKQILDQRKCKERIISFQKIDDDFYVGFYHGGLDTYVIETDSLQYKSSMLTDYTPSCVAQDSYGGLWITTTEKGIFYSPNRSITSLNYETGLSQDYIESLETNHSELYIGYQNGFEVYKNYNNTHELRYDSFGKKNWKGKHHGVIGCHFKELNRTIIDLCSETVYPYKNSGVRKIFKREDDWFVFIAPGFWRIHNYQLYYHGFNKKNGLVETGIVWNDTVYIGTNKGLFKIAEGDTVQMSKNHPLLGNRVVDLAISKTHGLVVATRGAGVLCYKDEKLTQISKRRGMATNDIVAVFVDDSDHIWVATNVGMYEVFGARSPKFNYYTTRDGLISNEITSIKQIDGKIYIGTKRGLSILDREKYQKRTVIPTVRITSILVDNEVRKRSGQLHLYPENRYLEVQFLSIDYAGANDLEYKYRIKGLSNQWYYTRARTIRIENIPEKGEYIIEIYSRIMPDGEWSKNPATISFMVHPPFYKTWTFQLSVAFLIILFIYLGFKSGIFRYDKHIQEELTDRILRRLGKKSYLVVKIDKEKVRIDQEQILYIQSFKDYCEIITTSKKYLYRSSLKKMEASLSSLAFIRVHRSYIIRKDKIEAIGKDHLVIEKTEIPIGKTYRDTLKSVRAQFSRVNT